MLTKSLYIRTIKTRSLVTTKPKENEQPQSVINAGYPKRRNAQQAGPTTYGPL